MILIVTGSRSITSQTLVDKACNTFVCEANLRFAESIQIKALKHVFLYKENGEYEWLQ